MTRRHAPAAFTLVELLIALVLVAIVGATIARLVIGQQRFYASVDERLAMRARLRDGADLLAVALRHAAVQGIPISLATDTAIELGTIVGAGTVCGASGARIDLAPDWPLAGHSLTSFADVPDTTDEILVYDRGDASSPAHWSRARIVDVASRPASGLCAASPLVSAVDVAAGTVTELTTTPPIAARGAAPVRVVRRARLDVYRGGDARYYLGYRTCRSGCTTVQPVAGPFGTSSAAVTMRYFDVLGAALPTPLDASALARVTRVDVVLRATSATALDLPGRGRGIARDSILASIALRNAP